MRIKSEPGVHDELSTTITDVDAYRIPAFFAQGLSIVPIQLT